MENPQEVAWSNPWSWHGRAAFGCFLFGFVASRLLRWLLRSGRLPLTPEYMLYSAGCQIAALLAYVAVLVLFILRIQSSWDSPYAADRPHWAKWVLLLAVTLVSAWWPIAIF